MISLERITKKYGQHYALQDVSLTIDGHQIAGILGRNGAGKTTALNLMTGYFPPDEGRVLVDRMDKKTIITTNLDVLRMEDRYGERILSRLLDKRKGAMMTFEGEVLRF